MEEIAKKRKFSLEDDFMNLTVDDIIFGYIQHLATYIPEKKILYVTEKEIAAHKQILAVQIEKTVKTVTNRINKLIENKLIVRDQLEINGQKQPVFIIPQNTIGKYKIAQDDVIWWIVSTRKLHTVKVYIYLLNKYDWKKELGAEMYNFTIGEMGKVIGYSESSISQGKVTSLINSLLISLKNEGIIDYEDYFDGKSPRKRLTFVVHSMDEYRERNN